MTTMGDWDTSAPRSFTTGDGAPCGLASIALGAISLLTAAATLVFNAVLFLWHSVSPRDFPRMWATVTAVVCILMMLALSCCGVLFGLKGLRTDRAQSRPSPLATAGVLLALAATIAWITVGIDLLLILSEF
jgi:hypothetical protein